MAERLEQVDLLPRDYYAYRLFDPKDPIVEQIFNYLSVDRKNLARLWLLRQYNAFSTGVDFGTARRVLLNQFKRNNIVTGTAWSGPSRKQILGKMREIKVHDFIGYYSQQTPESLDIFATATSAPIDDLFHGNSWLNRFCDPLVNARFRMRNSEWQDLLKISANGNFAHVVITSLPPAIETRLMQYEDNGSREEPIPF